MDKQRRYKITIVLIASNSQLHNANNFSLNISLVIHKTLNWLGVIVGYISLYPKQTWINGETSTRNGCAGKCLD